VCYTDNSYKTDDSQFKFHKKKEVKVSQEIKVGSQVKTRRVLRNVSWMGLSEKFLHARKSGAIGIVKKIHLGYTEDACVVRHSDSTTATYMFQELRRI
jgi:hypothetical protein